MIFVMLGDASPAAETLLTPGGKAVAQAWVPNSEKAIKYQIAYILNIVLSRSRCGDLQYLCC